MAEAGWFATKQRALAQAQPLSVHLELTYACNWACVFCYNPRRHDLRRLSGDEWVHVLEELRALGTLTLTLTGGEPLLHPDFFEVAGAARKRAFALRIFTNGTLVDDVVADRLAALAPAGIELSLHGGKAETHDRTTGRAGSFDAMMAGVSHLLARDLPVVLKTPLTRLNEDELEAMMTLAARLGVSYRVDAMLTPRDDGDQGPLRYRATPAGVERMFRRLAADGRLPKAERSPNGVNCGLGRVTMAIDPDGNVFPCIQWRTTSLGNVRMTPLRQLWAGSPVREEAASTSRAANGRLLEMGEDLAEFPFCPALAAQRTSDPLTPDADHMLHAALVGRIRRERT